MVESRLARKMVRTRRDFLSALTGALLSIFQIWVLGGAVTWMCEDGLRRLLEPRCLGGRLEVGLGLVLEGEG